jgi:hypothetical protein
MVVFLNPILTFEWVFDHHVEIVAEVEVVGEFVEGGHHTHYRVHFAEITRVRNRHSVVELVGSHRDPVRYQKKLRKRNSEKYVARSLPHLRVLR